MNSAFTFGLLWICCCGQERSDISSGPCFHFFLSIMPKSSIAGWCGNSVFNCFWRLAIFVSTVYTGVPVSSLSCQHLLSLSLCLFFFPGNSLPNWCDPLLGLISVSLWLVMLSIFSCVYGLFVYILWRNVHSSPLPVFNFLLLWQYRISVYLVGISPLSLSNTWFADTFSSSRGFHFT